MDEDRFRDLAVDYLISRLSEADRATFERELERRGDAGRRELERLRESIAAIALAAPPVTPPPELREQILEAIDSPTGGAGAGPGASEEGVRSRGRYMPIAVAGIAAAIAAALLVWNVQLRQQLESARIALEESRQRLATADSIAERTERLQQDLATIASSRASVVSLSGTGPQPEARARVFLDPITGRALLFAYDLPILPPDSIYQLWAIKDDQPVSAGTFSAAAEGPARLELDSIDTLADADALAVTIEPAPGQPAPTGAMVLLSSS